MNTKALLLLLGATALLSMKKRTSAARRSTARSGLPTQADDASPAAAAGSFGIGAINPAERLRESGVASPLGGSGTPIGTGVQNDDLFASSSAQGPDPVAPGLPDFTRGA